MQPKRRFYFYSLVLLSFLLLFGISFDPAAASQLLQDTVTPFPTWTATLESLFKTPTIAPTQSTACPGSMPQGWGTSTPGPLWLAQCYGCMLTLTPQVTSTPWPLPEWALTATAEAALTSTPLPSATPLPTTPTVTGTPIGGNCISATQTAAATPTVGASKMQESSFTYFGSWTTESTSNCDGGTCKYTNVTGYYWEKPITFDGFTALNVYGVKASNQGKWVLKIDGNTVATVDDYASVTSYKQLLASYTPPAGAHTVQGLNIGQKNGSSSGYYIEFDYLTYQGLAPTNTPWPTWSPISCNGASAVPCQQWDSWSVKYTGSGVFEAKNMRFTDSLAQGSCYRITVQADGYSILVPSDNVGPSFTTIGGANIYSFPTADCGTNCTAAAPGTYAFTACNDATDGFSFRGGMFGNTITPGASIWIATTLCLGGPTATPDPQGPSGYCSSVSGSSGSADLSDLPNIQLGPASCAGFGPFTIGLSSLNWLPGLSGLDNATIPSVEVCFREIYFGSVTIFGMSFSLDILSAVISGILALRWLFRS